MKNTPFISKEEAVEAVVKHGFTEHVDTSASGDWGHGSREYYARPGTKRNSHGWPVEAAVISQIGEGNWMLSEPENDTSSSRP